jgi:protocatechuate 3,4-dioxygenase beta subunit
MVAVMARSDSYQAVGYAEPQDDGAFRIGTLTPGRYELRARMGNGRSVSQYAEAGARNLVFELRARR